MRDGRGWVLREPAFEKEGEGKASARSCSHAALASNVQSSLEDGLKILKEVADLMKDIVGKLIFEQGEGVHKVLKPTRDAFICCIRHLREQSRFSLKITCNILQRISSFRVL